MANFVLVHGAFHGGWCWQKLTPLLQAAGHRVFTPDLSPPDDDRQETPEACLARWSGMVTELLHGLAEPAFLVGHSRGGIIISEVAEQAPERVAGLVYLAAFLVHDGESMTAARARLGAPPAGVLTTRDAETGRLVADPESVAALIYSDCPPSELDLVRSLLRAEPAAAFAIAPHLSTERFGTVLRTYVECTGDRVMPLAFQRGLQESSPCDQVMSLDCDHAPYWSAPQRLADLLIAHVARAE